MSMPVKVSPVSDTLKSFTIFYRIKDAEARKCLEVGSGWHEHQSYYTESKALQDIVYLNSSASSSFEYTLMFKNIGSDPLDDDLSDYLTY